VTAVVAVMEARPLEINRSTPASAAAPRERADLSAV
jgi:hypothetical protein